MLRQLRRLVRSGRLLTGMPRTTVSFPRVGASLTVEVADALIPLLRGLNYRCQLAPDHGLLLIPGFVADHRLTMKRTDLWLDIIFIDSYGRVANFIEDAEPRTSKKHHLGRPYAMALEVVAGWTRQKTLRSGDRIIIDRWQR